MTDTDLPQLPTSSLKPQEIILIDEIVEGRIHDPFAYLGRHREGRSNIVRVFYPDAVEVRLITERRNKPPLEKKMDRIDDRGIYTASISAQSPRYSLRILWADGWQETHDPYSFGTLIGDLDLYLFAEGNHRDIDKIMGAISARLMVLPVCDLLSGLPMPIASRLLAISISGMVGATRCGCVTALVSGNYSSLA